MTDPDSPDHSVGRSGENTLFGTKITKAEVVLCQVATVGFDSGEEKLIKNACLASAVNVLPST